VSSVISYAEGRSAIARAAHEGRVSAPAAIRALDQIWSAVQTLDVDQRLALRAGELAGRHLLRGMDALHLATALEVAAPDLPVTFATFDRPLAQAARAEGLTVPVSLGA